MTTFMLAVGGQLMEYASLPLAPPHTSLLTTAAGRLTRIYSQDMMDNRPPAWGKLTGEMSNRFLSFLHQHQHFFHPFFHPLRMTPSLSFPPPGRPAQFPEWPHATYCMLNTVIIFIEKYMKNHRKQSSIKFLEGRRNQILNTFFKIEK